MEDIIFFKQACCFYEARLSVQATDFRFPVHSYVPSWRIYELYSTRDSGLQSMKGPYLDLSDGLADATAHVIVVDLNAADFT